MAHQWSQYYLTRVQPPPPPTPHLYCPFSALDVCQSESCGYYMYMLKDVFWRGMLLCVHECEYICAYACDHGWLATLARILLCIQISGVGQ